MTIREYAQEYIRQYTAKCREINLRPGASMKDTEDIAEPLFNSIVPEEFREGVIYELSRPVPPNLPLGSKSTQL